MQTLKIPPTKTPSENCKTFKRTKRKTTTLTVLKERIANRFAIIVENPGARQDWAIKPNFSSAKQMTSSPCFQSQDGIFNK